MHVDMEHVCPYGVGRPVDEYLTEQSTLTNEAAQARTQPQAISASPYPPRLNPLPFFQTTTVHSTAHFYPMISPGESGSIDALFAPQIWANQVSTRL